MSDVRRGLPLLSGPPPSNAAQSESCRKCGKEFNVIFTRSRKCNHCGYLYCHSCSDYQALMPRGNEGPSGYDVMHVCGYCIEHLTITAAGKAQLKSMPLAKLKKYANAYNIRISGAVEKDDVIEALTAARCSNGCLSPDNETYYRRHSVPTAEQRPGLRNMFRSQPSAQQPPQPPPRETRPQPTFARPDLAPDPQPFSQQQYAYPNAHPSTHPSYVPPQSNLHWNQYSGQPYHQPGHNTGYYNPHYQQYVPRQPPPPPPPPSQASRPPPPNQTRQAPPPPTPRPQPAPAPSLDELMNMDTETIGRLGISSLKSILFANHVPAGQVLEKGELVRKVVALVDDERHERERQRQAQELEELERAQREYERRAELERAQRTREQAEQELRRRAERAQQRVQEEDDPDRPGGTSQLPSDGFETQPTSSFSAELSSREESAPAPTTPPKAAVPPSPTHVPRTTVERSGLCVVCQDEEANIAIVDCGHLCMCRGCSDLIMSSSRECPLCRTRIVTEARLLRIFKS